MKLIKFVAYGSLSLLAIVIGSAIILWVLYNKFVQQQPDFQQGGTPLGVGPVMLVTGIYWAVKAVQQLRAESVAEVDSAFGSML